MTRAARKPARAPALTLAPDLLGNQLAVEVRSLERDIDHALRTHDEAENDWRANRLLSVASEILRRAVSGFERDHDQYDLGYALSSADAAVQAAGALEKTSAWSSLSERANAIGVGCDSGIYRGLKERWPAAPAADAAPPASASNSPPTPDIADVDTVTIADAISDVARDAVWELDALLRRLPRLMTANDTGEHLVVRGVTGRMLRLTSVLMSCLDGDPKNEKDVERMDGILLLEGHGNG